MGVAMSNKRNVALLGQGGCGKTTLAEAMLNIAGATSRMGSIEEGNCASDSHPEEVRRRHSIYSSILPFDFAGHRITLVDNPGYLDFIGEAVNSLSVADGAVIVVNGVAGIEPQTRLAWENCQRLNIPRLLFINLLDKENSSWNRTLDACRSAFGKSIAPLVITIGEQSGLSGVVNILLEKAFVKDGDKIVEQDVPADMVDEVHAAHQQLTESIVETDAELFERYLADEPISNDELLTALQFATQRGDLCPAIGGAARTKIGVSNLLNIIIRCLPAPDFHKVEVGATPDGKTDSRPLSEEAPFSARVFKITSEGQLGEVYWMRIYSGTLKPGDLVYNPRTSEAEKVSALLVMRGKTREDVTSASAGDLVASVKLKGVKLGDTLCARDHPIVYPPIQLPSAVAYELVGVDDRNELEKAIAALYYYASMDPALRVVQDDETKELVVYGMGQLHLDTAASYVKGKTNVQVRWSKPRIPYRETITVKAESQGKFKKQTGGRGKYGDAHIRLEPQERGIGFEFVDAVVGGVVPNRFIPAVEKGVIESMEHGPISGSKVVDIKATLYFGSYHPVDSDELSFKVAGSMGFRQAFEKAGAILLEPLYTVTVYTPEEYMGDVMGDLNTRRGRVTGMDQAGGLKVVTALVPLAELYQYINTLRSMTQGQGYYVMEFSHYDQVPGNIQQEIQKAHSATRAAHADEH
ncbi:MAG: elongation factor G [bacterium]|nr:elongation factor G [bacterium]